MAADKELNLSNFDVNSFLEKTLSNFSLDQTGPAGFVGSKNRGQRAAKSRRPRAPTNSTFSKTPRAHSMDLVAADAPSETMCFLEPQSSLTMNAGSSERQGSVPSQDQRQETLEWPQLGASKNSLASGTSSVRAVCRICQVAGEPSDTLISPCRCSGTMQYVHASCLVHWLEISTKKMRPTPQCELCGYYYGTHGCFRIQKVHCARCSARDKALHMVFILVLLVMFGCAALTILYLKADRGYRVRNSLSGDDIIVIICSVLFFCAFFLAVFTQYRAEASLCRLLFRCWLINRHWQIKNYDPKEDPLLLLRV